MTIETYTNWEELDNVLEQALPKGSLTIFSGKTGSGKTNILTKLTSSMLDKQIVFISFELNPETILNRIRFFVVNKKSQKEISKHVHVESSLKFGSTVENIKEFINDYERTAKRKVDIIMVDNIDLLTAYRQTSHNASAYDPLTGFKNYLMAYNKIGFASTQTMREINNQGIINQNKPADNIFIVERDSLEYISGKGKVSSIIELTTTEEIITAD